MKYGFKMMDVLGELILLGKLILLDSSSLGNELLVGGLK